MRLKRLILPGRFVDVYLYFDFAWLFAKDGSVRAFDIATYCGSRLNGDGAAAVALFANNRELETGSALRENVNRLLGTAETIEAAAHDVDRFSYIFEHVLSFKSLLDARFYYGRGYIGTDNNIVQLQARNRQDLNAEHLGRKSRDSLGPRNVSERPARAFQCRFAAIGAACGHAGGLIGFGAANRDTDWTVRFQPFAERSFGLALNGNAVTNLANRHTVQLYAARLNKGSSHSLPWELEEVKKPARLEALEGLSYPSETASLNRIFDRDDAAGVFLFAETAWQFSLDGSARRVRLTDRDHNLRSNLSPVAIRSKLPGRVLAVSSTNSGVLAETDDQVLIMSQGEWVSLINEVVYSIRGYQTSKRYQNVVTAVTRDRAELISVRDDEVEGWPARLEP
jgi:hypothetical protein